MKFLRHLLIKDEQWAVKFLKTIAPRSKDGLTWMGYCDLENQVIEIKTRLPFRKRLNTYIHEIIHVLDDAWGLGLTHAQVYKLADAIEAFIVDNLL